MQDIAFEHIAARLGGQREAFEEFCCQVARRTVPTDARFVRLRGAGGDGGVECFADLVDGSRIGWQAKYVFSVDSLLAQLSESIDVATVVHPTLRTYIVCFPFDLTGPTRRKGKSGSQKFDEWCAARERAAVNAGRRLVIKAWPASELRSKLLEVDPSGGARSYFFDEKVLSSEWFDQHLQNAAASAGPRYTPELSIETELWSWVEAFGRAPGWSAALSRLIGRCYTTCRGLSSAVERQGSGLGTPAWPHALRQDAGQCVARLTSAVENCSMLAQIGDRARAQQCVAELQQAASDLSSLEVRLAEDVEAKHGRGRANSIGFRQFMAEYECSFPTANLDDVRKAQSAVEELQQWLLSPSGRLGFESVFVLTGAAGTGKTHGACDAANRRLVHGQLSCVAFGHGFGGEPDPWTRLQECLGLPVTLGRDALLDALSSAAEASGHLLVIWIDAINETRPLRYWRDRITSFAEAVQRRPNLRLCLTCRTSFAAYCLPTGSGLYEVEHRGFSGIEHEACGAFFRHYGLEPPIAPILQPELSNPLYLRLVCETLRARGLNCMPAGWVGLAPVVRAFLDEKERQFAIEHETTSGTAVVAGSLVVLAREIAQSGESAILSSRAEQLIARERPAAARLPVLEWLVRADLVMAAPREAHLREPARGCLESASDTQGPQARAAPAGSRRSYRAAGGGPLRPGSPWDGRAVPLLAVPVGPGDGAPVL